MHVSASLATSWPRCNATPKWKFGRWKGTPATEVGLILILTNTNTGNVADNFSHGALGNMVRRVDLETGRVERASNGVGLGSNENEPHPGTGQILVGVKLPDWAEAIKLAC